MSGTQWFIYPIGKNQKMLIDTITDELNRQSIPAETQKVDLTEVRYVWAYGVTSQMANYLKKEKANRGFNFRVYCLNPGSRFAIEDRYIYGGGLKKKPSKKVLAAKKAAEDILKKKK